MRKASVVVVGLMVALLAGCTGNSDSSGASTDGGAQDSGSLAQADAAAVDGAGASDVTDATDTSSSTDANVGSCLGIQAGSACPVLGATCQDGMVVCNGVSKPQTSCGCAASDPASPGKGFWKCEVNDCFGGPDAGFGGGGSSDVPNAGDATSATD